MVHSAARCSQSGPPCSPAKIASPAQNDGSIGVTGDCSVAKKSVTTGIDSTRSSRSGCTTRSRMTRLVANTSPISIRMSRARRAGKTLTSSSVTAVPSPTGITTNGATVSAATATNDSGAHLARPTPASTGIRNTTTIQPAWASVRVKRAMKTRRAATGATITSRRSSLRKKVASAETTPLKARNDRKVRNNHDRPMRIR